MTSLQVPVFKVGTKFSTPMWRFEALKNPQKYDLGNFCFTKPDFSGSLNRYAHLGLVLQINELPPSIVEMTNDFPFDLKETLNTLHQKHLKKNKLKKGAFLGKDRHGKHTLVFNVRMLNKIKDVWLKKTFEHYYGVEGYPEIDYAIRFFHNQENEEQLKAIGVSIFAGYPEATLAIDWNMPLSYVQALKYLFFDFSFLPKGRLARLASLRQMVVNGVIDNVDFALYKRVFDLGEVGLRAQLDYHSLNEDECNTIKEYLKNSLVDNTFKFQMSITNSRASKDFNGFMTGFAKLSMAKEELSLIRKRNELMEVQTRKLRNDIDGETMIMTDEDQTLLESAKAVNLKTEKDLDFTPLHELN